MPKRKTYSSDYTCQVCGKEFICYMESMWVYKLFIHGDLEMYCSWGCMQASRARNEQEIAERREKRKANK